MGKYLGSLPAQVAGIEHLFDYRFHNWARTYSSTAAVFFRPESIDQVCSASFTDQY